MANAYITCSNEEREILHKYIKERYGSENRISDGAAVRLLAEQKLEELTDE